MGSTAPDDPKAHILDVNGYIRDNEPPPGGVDYVGEDILTAATIAVGESWTNGNPIKGRIEHLYDVDWYRVELVKDHGYQIDIWAGRCTSSSRTTPPSTSMS